MKNGVQVIFALLGVIYRLANNDVTEDELIADKSIVKSRDFVYGKFLSCYSGDDIDSKLKHIVRNIIVVLTESYRAAYDNGLITSINYYFKSDSQYMDRLLGAFINSLSSILVGADIKSMMDIFRRP